MTQLNFGWSFQFALSKEAFTLKAGKFSWHTQEQYDTEKKTKAKQNLTASHWHDNLQSLTLLPSYPFYGLSTNP